jgi:hypothetical protein
MAALALAAGVAIALGLSKAPARAGEDAAVVNKVTLFLAITGLGPDGCEVEVKPGHPACAFEPVAKKVKSAGNERGELTLSAMTVKSSSPDRDCLFTITVKEPGQPPRVVKRGIRLVAPKDGAATPEQTFKCYLRSPSLAARDDAERRVR